MNWTIIMRSVDGRERAVRYLGELSEAIGWAGRLLPGWALAGWAKGRVDGIHYVGV